MKTRDFLFGILVGLLFAMGSPSLSHAVDGERPQILRIQVEGEELVITVFLPAGVQQATLEYRPRVASAWTPRAVVKGEAVDHEVTFRILMQSNMELLRIRADTQLALPTSFYEGTNDFYNLSPQAGVPSDDLRFLGPPAEGVPDAGAGEGDQREVVESDIWQIRGDTLYFFNQYRGLQIIDVSAPDEPRMQSSFSLPAAGEDLYLLESGEVVLLARNSCYSYSNSSTPESEVLILQPQNDPESIQVLSRMPVNGRIQESRMVGTALYVASQTYRTREMVDAEERSQTVWEWGTMVTSFDLSDPSHPVPQETLWFEGYGHVIHATDTFLFVVTQSRNNWWQSSIAVIDISSPDGALAEYERITPAGRVADKFKMNLNGGIFTVISEVRVNGPLQTHLQTFSLPDPDSLAPTGQLGDLQFADGERLFATRFDGSRVYVVTFEQVDPLWVIDLSDPENPSIVGELEVPGWSTHIEPMGDRLISVGIENNRVAVSLFDVTDPAAPSLTDRVFLGEKYSWSEANSDEKAFKVLKAENLILLPYQAYELSSSRHRMQLIDFTEEDLQLRGVIDHAMQARRATVHQDRILSLSGRELLTVNATDRDQPAVTSEVPLSWAVNRVFVQDDYLLQVENGNSWNSSQAAVRVSSLDRPSEVDGLFVLPEQRVVVGASVVEGKLYLLDLLSGQGYYPVAEDGSANGEEGEEPPEHKLALRVLDLENLPDLNKIGEVLVPWEVSYWWGSFDPFLLSNGTLAWKEVVGGWFWGRPMPFVTEPVVLDASAMSRQAVGDIAPYPVSSDQRLVAFDISDPANPKLASKPNLQSSENDRFSFSGGHAANDLVYVSYVRNEQVVVETAPDGSVLEESKEMNLNRYFLQVVDFTNPYDPVLRDPINIPGRLTGLSHQGNLIYTRGYHWVPGEEWTGNEWVDVAAYDGVSVSLVDSLELASQWPRTVKIANDSLWLGRSESSEDNRMYLLEAWKVSQESAQFERVGATELAVAPQEMQFWPQLLAVSGGNQVELLDVTSASDPFHLTVETTAGCFWSSLSGAYGSRSTGVWLPLGDYGTWFLPVSEP